jgi:hypothetical protein
MAKQPEQQQPPQPPQQQEDEQQFDIGNQDHFDNAPDEFKDHLTRAFIHAAGKGQHPGKYAGPKPEPPPEDAITEGDLQRHHEASYGKMHAAQTGGSEGLGPTEAEQTLAQQRNALLQQQAQIGAAAGAQAQQGRSGSPTPPPAPTGPQGVTQPYSSQAGAVGGSGQAPQPEAQPQGPPAAPEGGGSETPEQT